MAKKVLNLDEVLQTDARELILQGKTYVISEMTVQDYIESTKAAMKLTGSTDTELQMQETARLIARQVPGIDQAFLLALPLDKLYAIAEFVRGVDPEEIIRRAEAALTKDAEAAEPAEAGNV